MNIIISKEQFLIDHNKLSPANLKATFALLTKFQQEKKPLLKDAEWSNKLRIPFMVWLSNGVLKSEAEKDLKNNSSKDHIYRNYPETHY
ncbi:MAG: hypothetical protein A2312_00970 [Candidatus Staskawiczbacteria bacterium RIFOXYB2_FULL_32_9]|uniref:Uncharacterized protein n=1 Tax=Candidatus Staskawiczbacteria bacterium RIFOXYD1_FULL_32_13 TaxID=1802234 RepID=A0A1G2JL74_9BACT|nr:MAG: hypothetical protein UR22_C0015G0017 [Parcubacteria group bacterium GW2011_GWC2_32_10]OGZ77661.1 MAG: hypothetical protein A2256_02520 [Candidatus Staskawiczbacteria bacterium RIFOXYA2_FULL_32_7]OGZ82755.1 MAG: hypothetical protein A2312_00970 [Candidatus Staskawiczbacteria bacterium RIFOXYB2_FULL_32_9]OGZ87879.1 MAG: hypothetical protein A2561_01000 [Candidatus Staskawiczbacteria bacterium RIFOXYD1_FULL_32_13]OGZ88196.1 MAG: hypothetical protein A2463_04360 [Candidatus Staskawiczbacter